MIKAYKQCHDYPSLNWIWTTWRGGSRILIHSTDRTLEA